MKSRITQAGTLTAVTILCAVLGGASADAALIAHYTFDVDNAGTTPDSVSANFATLQNRVQINTTGGIPKVGTGTLEMLGNDEAIGPTSGAITNNAFSWANDARTITFWWRAASPNADSPNGAFVSFGDSVANGTRFDIKEQGATPDLRIEVQGTGANSNPANFDNGNWHFVAVVVPNSATFADIAWYVDGSATDLNTSGNSLDIATGTGPISFGDSILTGAGLANRAPRGFLDDFQLYDEALSLSQIQSLHANPGSTIGGAVIPAPAALPAGLAMLVLGAMRRRRR